MSHFLEHLTYLTRRREPFADGLGELREEDRMWEEGYRQRWQHDKVVRSTHGVNCTGGCSWKIYVKSGVVTWETQQTDYPRTRPGMPNHEPRGCSRGASYSWYLYSASRIKYPMVRSRLVKSWREARKTMAPVDAWAAIIGNSEAQMTPLTNAAPRATKRDFNATLLVPPTSLFSTFTHHTCRSRQRGDIGDWEYRYTSL
jgi:nitrate reductase / nitrite oxidoreductase, alpha subunit